MKVCLQLRLGLERPNRPGPPAIPTPSHQGLWQLARSKENICPFFSFFGFVAFLSASFMWVTDFPVWFTAPLSRLSFLCY